MTERLPPRPLSTKPADIERLADMAGISGRLERKDFEGWVLRVVHVITEKQLEKRDRRGWTVKTQLRRIAAFDAAAAAFIDQLKDGRVAELLKTDLLADQLVGFFQGGPHREIDEIDKELAAVLYAVEKLRARLENSKAGLKMLDAAKIKWPGNAAKPWVPWLIDACLEYHRQRRLASLQPPVQETALVKAMLYLLNSNSGAKDQLATARKRARAGRVTD